MRLPRMITGVCAVLCIAGALPVTAQNRPAPKPSVETMKRCLSFNLLLAGAAEELGEPDPERMRIVEGWYGLLLKEYGSRERFEQEIELYAENFVKEIMKRSILGKEEEAKMVFEFAELCGAYEAENFLKSD